WSHVVDVSPRTRRSAAPARLTVDDLLENVEESGELADLEKWLTRPIPAVVDDEPPTECFRAVTPPRRPRRLVRVAVVAVLTSLVAGAATAVAADKTVVVTVDGHDRVVHTFAADVA